MMNCCKGCLERTPTCHGSCKLYSAYKANIEDTKKAMKDDDRPLCVARDKKERITKYLKRRGIKK